MSTTKDKINALYDKFDENNDSTLQYCTYIRDLYLQEGEPEDCREDYANALAYIGQCWYWGWEDITRSPYVAWENLQKAYSLGDRSALEELGMCYYDGTTLPGNDIPDKEKAMALWKEGMDSGNARCALRWCAEKVDREEVDEDVIARLEALASDPEKPTPDAAAVLYQYYSWEGEEDKAWEWREKAIEMESPLMQGILDDEAEEEVEEDGWTQPEKEFDGYDDETEAEHPGYPDAGEKYVIVADTDDGFRIVRADASDWRSLPALIDAERCDDMRCEKFRTISKKLHLPGTLLGQLDKDAFRKPELEPNWHASQWYDGYADLMGDMVICMENGSYEPFSFSSAEMAEAVIDALKQ